jgi:hypothetical protein
MGGQHHAPDAFTPRKGPVPIVQEAGWAPGPVWTCAKNVASTGIFFINHFTNYKLCQNTFDPRNVQPVVSHYTDWATRPKLHTVYYVKMW